jgi:hypothetical protein
MSATDKVALVVGAQGVIGKNLIEHLASLGDWEVIGLACLPSLALGALHPLLRPSTPWTAARSCDSERSLLELAPIRAAAALTSGRGSGR